jgi:hypothetical protein
VGLGIPVLAVWWQQSKLKALSAFRKSVPLLCSVCMVLGAALPEGLLYA